MLDSLDLIVGTDGTLGARAFLFRNAVAGQLCRAFFEDVWNSTYGARAGSHHWDRRYRDYGKRGLSVKVRLGIDIACRAHHQASATDETGEFIWSGRRFRTTPVDLEALWAKLPEVRR